MTTWKAFNSALVASCITFIVLRIHYQSVINSKTCRLVPQEKASKSQIQIYDEVQPDHDGFLVATLKTRKGDASICLFHTEDDGYISRGIIETGRWEGDTFDTIQTLFEKDPELQFLDIGCHVGNFALMAAKWGRKVLAVDSSFESLVRLRRSCDLNHFGDRITTIWNAVGDEYKNVTTRKYIGNYAAGYIVEINSHTKPEVQEVVPMIHLDDLLSVMTFKRAVMKLDIEAYEAKALKSAEELFSKVDIPYVFMKWHLLKKNAQSARSVMNFFFDRGYRPYGVEGDGTPLGDTYMDWPTYYYWRKMSI